MKLTGHFYGGCLRANQLGAMRRLALATVVAVAALGAVLTPLDQAGAGAAIPTATSPLTLPQSPANLSLSWAVPNYPVGRQMRWLLGIVTKPPVPTVELKAHFDPRFLSLVPPAMFNKDLESLHLVPPLRIVSLSGGSTTGVLEAEVATGPARLGLVMSVDAHGLIEGLQVSPPPTSPPGPRSWAALDAQVRSLAPEVSFEAATLTLPTLTSTATTTVPSTPASTPGRPRTVPSGTATSATSQSVTPTTTTATTTTPSTTTTTTDNHHIARRPELFCRL